MACYMLLLFTVFCLFFLYAEKHEYSAVLKHALELLVEYGYPEFRRKQNEQLADDINSWNVFASHILTFHIMKERIIIKNGKNKYKANIQESRFCRQ